MKHLFLYSYTKRGVHMVGFGKRLKQARNELHLTQEQLAARLGISREALVEKNTMVL
jgi:DNA-binding XRE family transcriptional regulator